MAFLAKYYELVSPVCNVYVILCALTSMGCQFLLYHPEDIALKYELVFSRFQVWRLITNFFFLDTYFVVRLVVIALFGSMIENGPFKRRTAGFLWMMMLGALSLLVLSAIPLLRTPFLGTSVVFMIVYIWSSAFPNAQFNGPLKWWFSALWVMLSLDIIWGSPILPRQLGILVGHFLSVFHPIVGGKNVLKTPIWVHKLVARW